MVFDFEKAKEDRDKLKKNRETAKEERRQEIIGSVGKESGREYIVYIDIDGGEDFRKEPIRANSAIEAISSVLLNTKMKGIRIVEKNCMAKDVETGELFSVDGKSEQPLTKE